MIACFEASQFIRTIEKQQGLKIACLEEIGYKNGWLTLEDLEKRVYEFKKTDYGQYLNKIIKNSNL